MSNKPPGQWSFIGCDPGVTCGVAWGTYTRSETGAAWDLRAASCDAQAYFELLQWKLSPLSRDLRAPLLVCVEKFVTAGARGQSGKPADLTRALVADTVRLVSLHREVKLSANRATDVKPWGSDERLKTVGFPMAPKLKDAKDAGRHLIYGAFKHGIADDPLL